MVLLSNVDDRKWDSGLLFSLDFHNYCLNLTFFSNILSSSIRGRQIAENFAWVLLIVVMHCKRDFLRRHVIKIKEYLCGLSSAVNSLWILDEIYTYLDCFAFNSHVPKYQMKIRQAFSTAFVVEFYERMEVHFQFYDFLKPSIFNISEWNEEKKKY